MRYNSRVRSSSRSGIDTITIVGRITRPFRFSERLVIADKQDNGSLEGDDLDLALSELGAQAQQMDQANSVAAGERIQTINSFLGEA